MTAPPTSLAALPLEHPLRNTPLGQIGADERSHDTIGWRKVLPHWGIGKSTYNQLGPAWTATCEFRVVQPTNA